MATYRERLNYADMAKDTVEIGGGFIVSGFTGRYIEDKLKPNVMPSSPTSDKIIAGVANNGPKLALYYLFNKINLKGAAAAVMGSIGFDALIRATNNGINPASVYINQYRVLNENNIPDWAERQRQFGAMPTTPDVLERERRFGAMPALPFEQNQETIARQRRYGSMDLPDRPDLLERRRYGAMPFEQNPAKTERQRRFGSMKEMGFKSERSLSNIETVFNMK